MQPQIYLDNAATTCLDKRVLETMMPYFSEFYGNPSSMHTPGAQAKEILDRSRMQIARCIGAQADEIVFTSGGTEANNMAVKGIAFANRHKGNHIIVSAIEHDCVLNACKWLEEQGFYISYLPVDHTGMVDPEDLKKIINPKTILVSVMLQTMRSEHWSLWKKLVKFARNIRYIFIPMPARALVKFR